MTDRLQAKDGVEEESLTFLASIAPLQSAIKIASDGGARVSLDIPESEMPAIVRLVLYRAKTLRITVETFDNGETPENSDTDRRSDRNLSSVRLH